MQYLRSFRVQILLWTILPLILILVAVSIGSITLHQQSMRDMVADRNAHLASLAAARLDDQFKIRASILETYLSSTENSNNLPQTFKELQSIGKLFDRGIVVFDDKNNALLDFPTTFQSPEQELQEILTAARGAAGSAVYRLVFDKQDSWMLVALADSQTNRIVVGELSFSGLNSPALFDHINRDNRREAYLIAPDGRVIYHRDNSEIGRDYTIHSGVNDALQGGAGATFEQLEGDDEHVVGYAPVATTGWALLVEEPWEDVIVPGLQYTLWAPILVLIAAIASLSAVHFGLWRIIRPLQVLGREASRLAWGDFSAIEKPAGGIAEIRDLQSTLQEMAFQIHRSQDGMRDYIAVLTRTQEEERKRLARELHDVIAQSVIALGQRVKILQMDWSDHRADVPEIVASKMDHRLGDLSERIGQCLADVRSLIRDLRPIYLEELGLVSALETLALSTETKDLQVSFEIVGEERAFSFETNLAIYRIAQAAINNAVRHGQPEFIVLQLEFVDGGVMLTVEDDGSGFTPPERPSDLALQGHYGLVGMHERAIRLGGHLNIRSAPGMGTRIAAFLPDSLPENESNLLAV